MRLVIHWWMVLGAVIGQVVGPRIPMVADLILIFATLDPVKTHVRRFGVSGPDGVFGYTS